MTESETDRPLLMHVTTVPHTLMFLIGQIGFIRRAGFQVEAISSIPPGDTKLAFVQEHESVPHTQVAMKRTLNPLHDLWATWNLFRVFRTRRPAIVHAHTPKAGLLAMLAARISGVPVRVYHIHGLRFTTMTGWKRLLIVVCERLTCRLATNVFCVSRSARAIAVDQRIGSAEKIQVIANGSINGLDSQQRFNPSRLPDDARSVTRSDLNIPTDAVVLGFVGRLVKDKGVEDLTSAWQILREQFPQLHLLVVGDYEAEDPVSEATRSSLDGDDRVHHCSFALDTPRMYNAMDVFCLPSRREGLPYVILEASAMQLPVVATNATGCVDAVVNGVTGTLVEIGDVDSLRCAIAGYVADRGLAAWHAASGRRYVNQSFQPKAIQQALLDSYLKALRIAKIPGPRSDAESLPAEVRVTDSQRKVA